MSDDELRRLLATYGADTDRWPDGLGAAARRRLAESPDVRAEFAAAAAFDRRLAGTPPRVEEERVRRLLAHVARAVRRPPRETLLMLLLGPLPGRAAGALAAAMLLMGWLAGGLDMLTAPPAPPPTLLAFDPPTLFDEAGR